MGVKLGNIEGDTVGSDVGNGEGALVGTEVGNRVGAAEGKWVGDFVTPTVGLVEGAVGCGPACCRKRKQQRGESGPRKR